MLKSNGYKWPLIIILALTMAFFGWILSYAGMATECNHPECPACPDPPPCPDPPECPTCPDPPECPTCPDPPPCPTCPDPPPCPPQSCCQIYLTFILNGKHYHDMNRIAVPGRGDTILFGNNVRGKVISVYWDSGRKHATIFCKKQESTGATDQNHIIAEKRGCDITLQYIRDGEFIDSSRYCDVPMINDVILFDDESRLYIVNVLWLTESNVVVVSGTAERNDDADSAQEAQIEQSKSGCFISISSQ